jgi:putative peptidoglycan lipid II flippase
LTSKGQILKSASVIAVVTAISRICGYIRDQRVALLLGTSPAADSFILVFSIPSMVRRMVGEGALSASFIPIFSGQLRNRPRAEAWAFAQKVFWDIALVLAIIAVLGAVFSRQVIYLFTMFGGNPAHWTLAVFLNRIVFPCVFLLGLAAVAAAILNSFHVFALPASTSIFFNLAIIALSVGAVYRPVLQWAPERFRTPAVALGAGVLLGAAMQFGIQVPSLVRRGMKFAPKISFRDPDVRKFGSLMGPSLFSMGVYPINLLVDKLFATSWRMPAGSVTSLYVAERVVQLVLGSYAIAMATALLPTMSHQFAAGNYAEMKRTFAFSLRVVSFIAIPAAVGLILLRRPIIQVLFQHGEFVAGSTTLTARALLYYSLGLPAFAAIKLITPMYYSMQDTMTPARIGAWTLGLNIALNTTFLLVFFRYLSNGSPALASTLAAYFNFAMLFVLFRRRYGRLGGRAIMRSGGKMAICAAAMAAVSFGALKISGFATAQHFLSQAGMLAAVILASTGVYFGVAWLLRCEELSELLLLLRRAEPAAASTAVE